LQVLLEDWLAAIFHHRLKQMAKRRIWRGNVLFVAM
jgi:hypothetical protein